MPKLNKQTAAAVNDAESSDFSPLEEGSYVCKLVSVTVKEGRKAPYWEWIFKVDDGGDFNGRQLWNNTSLSEAAAWKMKEAFDAFGVPADTDTDLLLGKQALLLVEQTVIEQGARKGQVGNNVVSVLPLTSADAVEGGSAADDDDMFG